MIFRHKHENFLAYETLKKIEFTMKPEVFRTDLERNLAGIDVFFQNLAVFSYKLGNYEEVITISRRFIEEIGKFLANGKELEKLKLNSFAFGSINFFQDFFLQKKTLLSYFHYILAKSLYKIKDEKAALESIKFALNLLEDKTHEFFKKYNSFLQQIISRLALKHSINVNYDDFKRNLQEEQAINLEAPEISFDFLEKTQGKVAFAPTISQNYSQKKEKTNKLQRFLMVSETMMNNKKFFDQKRLFNQSLINCSTTIRKKSPSTTTSRSILKSKASSFHQKFDVSNIINQNLTVKFPFDMKSLLIERPKSARISDKKPINKENSREKSKEKPKEKIEEKKFSLESKEKSFKSIIKELNQTFTNKELPEIKTIPPPMNTLQKVTQKILKKAFTTKFNLVEDPHKSKPYSKIHLTQSSRGNTRRFSEKPDFFQKKLDPLKSSQGHKRFSSVGGVTYSISSAGKSPGLSSPKKLSVSIFSGFEDSSDEFEVKSIELKEVQKESKDLKPLAIKLATISHVGSEESKDFKPAGSEETPNKEEEKPKTLITFEEHSILEEKSFEKIDLNVPFVKVVFAWVLLKRKKLNLQKKMLGELVKMPIGRFFGAEFEILREKIQKILKENLAPFWFFCKPPDNSSIFYWKLAKISLDLRNETVFNVNELEDLAWNIKGIVISARVILQNSRAKGPCFVLDLKEPLEPLIDLLKEMNEGQRKSDLYYNFIDLLLNRFIEKWESKGNEAQLHIKSMEFKGNEEKVQFNLISEKQESNQRKKLEIKGFLKQMSSFEEENLDINKIYEKLSYIIANVIKLKRNLNGFSWSFRTNPLFVQEEKNIESLIQKNKAFYKEKIAKSACFRKPLGIFRIKEKKTTGFLNIFKRNSDGKRLNNESQNCFNHRNSLLNALQRNSKNSLLVCGNQYQINEIKAHEQRFFRENRRKSLKRVGSFLGFEIKEEDYSPPRNLLESKNQNFSGLLKKNSQEKSKDFFEEILKKKLNLKDFSQEILKEKSCINDSSEEIYKEQSIKREISEENKKEPNEIIKENEREIVIEKEICLEKEICFERENTGLNREKNEIDNMNSKKKEEVGLKGLIEELGMKTQESENFELENSLIMKEKSKNEGNRIEDCTSPIKSQEKCLKNVAKALKNREKISSTENFMNISENFKIQLLKLPENRKKSFKIKTDHQAFVKIEEISSKKQESSKIQSTPKIPEILENAKEISNTEEKTKEISNIAENTKEIQEKTKEISENLNRTKSLKILNFSKIPEIIKKQKSVRIPKNEFSISQQKKLVEISKLPENITENPKISSSQFLETIVSLQTEHQSFEKLTKKIQGSPFPEKPYNIEANSIRFFLNPFTEKYHFS